MVRLLVWISINNSSNWLEHFDWAPELSRKSDGNRQRQHCSMFETCKFFYCIFIVPSIRRQICQIVSSKSCCFICTQSCCTRICITGRVHNLFFLGRYRLVRIFIIFYSAVIPGVFVIPQQPKNFKNHSQNRNRINQFLFVNLFQNYLLFSIKQLFLTKIIM